MIKDLLDAKKIASGKSLSIEKRTISTNAIIEETVKDLEAIHGSRFVIKATDKIMGDFDEGAIKRLLENLCINSVKYVSKDTKITITLKLEGTKQTCLSVHNEGHPIPNHEIHKLFQQYKQLKNENKQQIGWGIGSSLVKGIPEAHSGKILVQSSR